MLTTRRIASIIAGAALFVGVALTGAGTASADPLGLDEGRITTDALTMRYAPTSHSKRVATFYRGETVNLVCKVQGETVDGNDVWYSVPTKLEQWVAAKYVVTQNPVPWCANSKAKGQVTTATLSKRSGPSTSDNRVGSLRRGAKVDLVCKVKSQSIRGNKLWYQTADRNWVSAKYIKNVGKAPGWCNL